MVDFLSRPAKTKTPWSLQTKEAFRNSRILINCRKISPIKNGKHLTGMDTPALCWLMTIFWFAVTSPPKRQKTKRISKISRRHFLALKQNFLITKLSVDAIATPSYPKYHHNSTFTPPLMINLLLLKKELGSRSSFQRRMLLRRRQKTKSFQL